MRTLSTGKSQSNVNEQGNNISVQHIEYLCIKRYLPQFFFYLLLM